MKFDDKKMEEDTLQQLLDTIREKISSFHDGMDIKEMSKPEEEESAEDEAMESPEEQSREEDSGEEMHKEPGSFKDFLEGKEDKEDYKPKGAMMSIAMDIRKKGKK